MGEVDPGTAFMTPAQILNLHDRFLRGNPLSESQLATCKQISLAASFGAQAFSDYPGCGGGAVGALARAFLLALVDPLHPDLDHLRQDPESGRTARGTRTNGPRHD